MVDSPMVSAMVVLAENVCAEGFDCSVVSSAFTTVTGSVQEKQSLTEERNSAAEMRLSIYGMEREWFNLAQWVLRDWRGQFPGPVLSTHNRWIIQVPRLWRIFCMKGNIIGNGATRTFQDMLECWRSCSVLSLKQRCIQVNILRLLSTLRTLRTSLSNR